MSGFSLKIKNDVEAGKIRLIGPLDLFHLRKATRRLEKALDGRKGVKVDISGLEKLDTSGALLLNQLVIEKKILLQGLKKEHEDIFALVTDAKPELPEPEKQRPHFVTLVEHIGKSAIKVRNDAVEIITFFGQSCIALVKALSKPRELRYGSITHHIEHIGINAIPIVALVAFLISIVLAYQGVAQLRPLGAEQFTVNLIAVSVLREMGVMLTAIMVAGRSGSAFTAEIGVMKVREEVDALRAIGVNPFEVLVVPRLIALIIALPLLTFVANIMGLLGGAVLSLSLIGITLTEYLDRIQTIVTGKILFVGMIKAPVFAMAIGVIGCLHGMKVSGSAESVGQETTSSVVKAIFLVLMLDAAFSILFEQLKI